MQKNMCYLPILLKKYVVNRKIEAKIMIIVIHSQIQRIIKKYLNKDYSLETLIDPVQVTTKNQNAKILYTFQRKNRQHENC